MTRSYTTGWLFSLVLLAVFTLAGTGCPSGPPVITIEEQEARLSPVIIGSGSVYLKIVNAGSGGDTLVKARINIPDTVTELHEYREGKMTKIDRISIPPETTVQLRPASYHIMIFRMPKEVKEGSSIIATLSFDKYGEVSVPLQFTVSAINQRRGSYR